MILLIYFTKQWLYHASAMCPWRAAASRNGGQGTLALDGFIGTHNKFSLQVQSAECASSAPFCSMDLQLWKVWALLKVKLFVWLVLQWRLWMADRWSCRGLQSHINCPLCEQESEVPWQSQAAPTQGKFGLESLDMPTCRYSWRLPRPLVGGTIFAPMKTRSTSRGSILLVLIT